MIFRSSTGQGDRAALLRRWGLAEEPRSGHFRSPPRVLGDYAAFASRGGQPRRRVKHFSPPRLLGCDCLKHGAPSARGHVVKGHVARPARNPPGIVTTASDPSVSPLAGTRHRRARRAEAIHPQTWHCREMHIASARLVC
jgi:hypothetical protein